MALPSSPRSISSRTVGGKKDFYYWSNTMYLWQMWHFSPERIIVTSSRMFFPSVSSRPTLMMPSGYLTARSFTKKI